MAEPSRLRGFADYLLSAGSYPDESETQGGKRRIMVGALWLASLLTIPTVLNDFADGRLWVGVGNVVAIAVAPAALFALWAWPRRFALIISFVFIVIFSIQLAQSALLGGFFPSGLVVIFGLIIVLAALIVLSLRAAVWWFVAFVVSIVYAVVIPNWIDPVYVLANPSGDAAFNVIATSVITFAGLTYFVRQRDQFQKQSDDLLHNVLPDSIADRLKASETLIADSFESASVLFADVVDFTPMSAGMPPSELVGLLNSVFTTFDGFVEELGLEKIKTVGDEYMVASGIPVERPDHAEAIADLALKIRDHVAINEFEGQEISLRIGINSGPVVAGIIGSHKFSYDLWGDVVNIASRMESGGVPGSIQVSQATYQLIQDEFVCEPRGVVSVKGKGNMDTYFLVSRRGATVS